MKTWQLHEEKTDSGFGPALVVRDSSGQRIADCGRSAMSDGSTRPIHREQIANARIIASARELLEACKGAALYFETLDEMQPDKNHGVIGDAIRAQVRAALKKAGVK